MRKSNKLAIGILMFGSTANLQAAATTPETVHSAQLFWQDKCPLGDDKFIKSEIVKGKEIAGFLVPILAGLAGELVKSGINAVASSLEEASKKRAIVAEGLGSFQSLTLQPRDFEAETPQKLARLVHRDNCLILAVPGSDNLTLGRFKNMIVDSSSGSGFRQIDNEAWKKHRSFLTKEGVTNVPGFYAEIRLLDVDEGYLVRPVTLWYRQALPKAPRGKPTAAELHLTMAVPGDTDIGKVFANARLKLPKIRPGTSLDWSQLKSTKSIVIPHRPNSGYVENKLTATNLLYTTEATRKRELIGATRLRDAADRKHSADRSAENKEKLITAVHDFEDAKKALASAQAQAEQGKQEFLGWTNAKARFVVIKQPNKFGLAVASALKSQAEAAGKAVTSELTPKPAFGANNTAFVTAKTALQTKEAEYNAALAKPETDDLALVKLRGEVEVAKAKLNEAAVSVGRPLPYPDLF